MEVAPTTTAAPLLLTARLRLVAADEHLAAAFTDFHDRNRSHLAPWDPPTDPEWFAQAAQAQRLRDGAAAFAAGKAYRYLLQPIGDSTRVIGSVHFSNIVRGPFQSCNLGYALDRQYEGQAFMTEALRCAIAEMFAPHINLHRIQAGFRPENWRSAEVLKRLGFVDEGLASDYLFIDGMWRVHRLAALLNKSFITPTAWQVAG
jgi:ribosomal-protein-alanine N-acetyltransferase